MRRLLTAAKSVIDNGHRFDVPDCLEEKKTDYIRKNDPAQQFFTECCRIRPTPDISSLDECTCKNVFEIFRLWCRDNAPGYVPKKGEFKKTCANLLALPVEEIIIRKKTTTYYTFTLSEETKDEYGKGLFLKQQF